MDRADERYAICGGTFNPVHLGHIAMGHAAVKKLGYAKALFIPANASPHKEQRGIAPPGQRSEMLRLALEDLPWAGIDERELRRGGKSYTVDTARELIAERPGIKPGLLIGGDIAGTFHAWKEARLLSELCDLIVFRRGDEVSFPFPHRAVRDFEYSVSSTLIRKTAKNGGDLSPLLPAAVECHIRKHGLYSSGEAHAE